MGALSSNFIKRAVIIPAIVTVIIIIAVMIFVPKAIADSHSEVAKDEEVIDISQFDAKEYTSISKLSHDGYVGSIECGDVALGEVPIVYNALETNNVSAIKGSVEPWGKTKGGIVLEGSAIYQLNSLNNAKIGDKIVFNFYGNNSYTYTIKKIVPTAQKGELKTFLKDKTLAVAVPFNDFSSVGDSYFYTVYVAETE